ncbi:MAG: DUF2975 domain-containing protein [Maribacter sp.]|nr:DUF2975 domain-containing protein [Maribacter sp.]
MISLSSLFKWLTASFIFLVGIQFLLTFGQLAVYLSQGSFNSKQIIGIRLPEQFSDAWFIVLVLITSIALAYFIFYLLKLWVIANDFSKREVFSKENAKSLNSIGKGICIFTVTLLGIDFILNLSYFFSLINQEEATSLAYTLGKRIGYIMGILAKWFPLLILAIFMLILSELIAKGSLIKSENDLTI